MTSTAGDAALSVADPSSVATGHLVNGAFAPAADLQAARNAAGTGTRSNVGSATVADLLTTAPVSNDAVAIEFKQSIGANDAAAHGDVQQDADVHAVDDQPVGGAPPRAAGRTRPAARGETCTPADLAVLMRT